MKITKETFVFPSRQFYSSYKTIGGISIVKIGCVYFSNKQIIIAPSFLKNGIRINFNKKLK